MRVAFSYEVPLYHLEDFDQVQDFYFAISFLFKNKSYATFIKNQIGKKPVWLDNSMNELRKPETVKDLARLDKEYGPFDKIVAPDHIDWGMEKLVRSALELAELVGIERTVCVVQTPAQMRYAKTYGLQHFAVPYAHRYVTPDVLRQFEGCHFLGLVSISELAIARPASVDTAMPVKLALEGKSVEQWIKAGCPHIHTKPKYFDAKLTPAQLTLAKANAQLLKQEVALGYDEVYRPMHYTQGNIEVLDFILDQKLPYLAGQVLKYICRYKHKDGIKDLKKAAFYLDRLIKEMEKGK